MKVIATALFALGLTCFGIANADEPSTKNDEVRELRTRVQELEERIRELEAGNTAESNKEAISLEDAVDRFNARAAMDKIGRTQPPLTVEEVIAAIRMLHPDQLPVPVTSEEFKAYKRIADTQTLPPGADLHVISGFAPDDQYHIKAWSVRLEMPRTAMKGWTYQFPIRQRWISWAHLKDHKAEPAVDIDMFGERDSRTTAHTAKAR